MKRSINLSFELIQIKYSCKNRNCFSINKIKTKFAGDFYEKKYLASYN